VEITWEGKFRSLVPLSDTISLVRKITIRSDTRPVMTNEIKRIRFRKYLRPYDSTDFIKEIILSLNLRGHPAEFAFYFQKMLYGLTISRRAALHL
jgi:hypothetical protein